MTGRKTTFLYEKLDVREKENPGGLFKPARKDWVIKLRELFERICQNKKYIFFQG
jgi:hypothetical protein